MQLNSKNTSNNPIKNWGDDLDGHFYKDIKMDNKYIKEYLTSLIIRKCKSELPLDYQLTLVRIAIVKKIRNSNADEVAEKKESLYTIGGNISWYSHYRKHVYIFKKLKLSSYVDLNLDILYVYNITFKIKIQ